MTEAAVLSGVLRPATMDDAELLLRWRNDPLTRAMSVTQGHVGAEAHYAWLRMRLRNLAPPLIYERDGEPCGTIRLDGGELSWTVAPECRGRGVGSEMVAAAVRRFGVVEKLTAKIKPENTASLRIAAKCGIAVTLI